MGVSLVRISQQHTWPDKRPATSTAGSRGLNSIVSNGDDDFNVQYGLLEFSMQRK